MYAQHVLMRNEILQVLKKHKGKHISDKEREMTGEEKVVPDLYRCSPVVKQYNIC